MVDVHVFCVVNQNELQQSQNFTCSYFLTLSVLVGIMTGPDLWGML